MLAAFELVAENGDELKQSHVGRYCFLETLLHVITVCSVVPNLHLEH